METKVKEPLDVRWAQARLEDITKPDAKILYGILQPGPDIPDGVPYVRPTEMDKDEIILDQIRRTTPAIAAKYKRSLLEEGDVLLSIVGTIGKVAIVPLELEGGNITQSSVRIRAGAKLTSDYLAWYLRSPGAVKQYDAARLGTAVPRLNVAHVRDMVVPIPPLPEQRRIVSAIETQLGRLDAAVARLHSAKAKLKRYKQAVLKAAFDGLEHGVESGGWKWIPFKDAVNNLDGKRVPLSKAVRAKRQGSIPYYGATGIVDYVETHLFDGRYLLIGEDGANLLSRARPLSFIAEGKIWVNNHAHVLQPKEGVDIEYLCLYFNSLDLTEYVTGSAQPKLTQANMNKIPIPLCSPARQQEIARAVQLKNSAVDELESTLDAQLLQSTRLRQAVLKRAFEGRLV